MKVLVACEYSGTVRDAFIRRGIEAVSCDLDGSQSKLGRHVQGDVLELIAKEHFDLMIAHPPCTYLTNSSVEAIYRQVGRWDKMLEGAAFFKALWESKIRWIAVENPVMHKYAKAAIGIGKPTQVVQPYHHGHSETKTTCLWLKGLPKLRHTNIVPKGINRLNHIGPCLGRSKMRSKTYQGIAEAMADQWSVMTKYL